MQSTCRILEDTMGQHGIGDLQEASDVGACLQVRVVLLCSLRAPTGHAAHMGYLTDNLCTAGACNDAFSSVLLCYIACTCTLHLLAARADGSKAAAGYIRRFHEQPVTGSRCKPFQD